MPDMAKCARCLATKSVSDLVDIQFGYGACRDTCAMQSPPPDRPPQAMDASLCEAGRRIDRALAKLAAGRS